MSAAPTSRPLTEESDWDLVVAVKNGEDRAFEILVNRYKARILSLAFRITRNHEDAQDVTQQIIQRENKQILSFVIDRLPPRLQGAVRLYLDDLTVEEMGQCLKGVSRMPNKQISGQLGTSENIVKVQRGRAMKKIQARFSSRPRQNGGRA